jgi:hypothetical protein
MCDDIIDIAALKLHRKSKTVQNNEGTGPDDLEEESEMHEIPLEGLRIVESQSVKLVCKKFCTLSLFFKGPLFNYLLQKSSQTVWQHF